MISNQTRKDSRNANDMRGAQKDEADSVLSGVPGFGKVRSENENLSSERQNGRQAEKITAVCHCGCFDGEHEADGDGDCLGYRESFGKCNSCDCPTFRDVDYDDPLVEG